MRSLIWILALGAMACGTNSDVTGRLDDADAAISDLQGSVEGLTTDVEAATSEVSALETRVGTIEEEAIAAGDRLDSVDSDLVALGERVTSTEARLDAADAANADLADRVSSLESLRTVSLNLPAQGLGWQESPVITADLRGLRWTASYQDTASYIAPAPADYAGGDVTMTLTFYTTTATAGAVQFFARPRSFTPGDTWLDGSTTSNAATPVSATAIFQQQIVLPANRFLEPIWYIALQREGALETYPDPVVLTAVTLAYEALP